MKLYHYADQYIDEMEDKTHLSDIPYRYKPRGLWVTPLGEGGWEDWIKREQFRLNSYTHITEVELDLTNILCINSSEQLRNFTKTFTTIMILGGGAQNINWNKVKTLYKGVLIIPYLWDWGVDINWYYGWDCASGCIWGKDAVVSLRPFGMVKYESDACTGS
jgi:hypothetical protein